MTFNKLKTATAFAVAITLFTASFAFAKNRVLVVTKDNVISLNDEVNSETVTEVLIKARQLDANLKSGYPIVLVLYTPGGSIQDGIELMEGLRSLNRPVNTVTMFAASMGFQFVQGLNQRYILESGTLMSHKARGGFSGEFGDGVSQLDARYGFWLKRLAAMDMQTVSRTKGKQTLASYRRQYENELWLSSYEAVKMGYADEVVKLKCDSTLSGSFTRTYRFMGVSIVVGFSECPLVTSPVSVDFSLSTNKGTMTYGEFVKQKGVIGGYPSEDKLIASMTEEDIQKAQEAVAKWKKEFDNKRVNVIKGY